MPLPRNQVERELTRKLHMTLRNRSGDDHRTYVLVVDGKQVAKTKVSMGSAYRTLGDNLVGMMARQLRVPAPFFRSLDTCTKSRDDYLTVLRDQGFID